MDSTSTQSNSFTLYEFGPFRLNVNDRLLERGHEHVQLTPKVFDTLLLLVERRGHVVEKNALMELLWPDSFVEESSLTQNICLLRKALNDSGSEHQYIETIPKRGYRFVAGVHEVTASNTEMLLQERRSTEIVIDEEVEDTAKEPAPHTFAAAVRALRGKTLTWVIAAGVVLIAALGIMVSASRNQPVDQLESARSVAILPFQAIGTEDTDLVGLGIADALIVKLGHLSQPIVLPTSSITKYTKREKATPAIGKELGVDVVLDGTFQRDGNRTRVTAQLIRTSDGKLLWSGKFDEPYVSSFALQDSVSDFLAKSLRPAGEGKAEALRRPTENNEAYQAYLTGFYFWNRRHRENLTRAIPYFEQAIQKDPGFALAHALLADCFYVSIDANFEIRPRSEELKRAHEEVARALELDDRLAEAHTVKAGMALLDNDPQTANREFQSALQLNPNYPVAHLRYGYFLFSLQRIHEADSQMDRAQELDPVSPVTNTARGFIFFMNRDYESAIRAYQKALEFQPDTPAPLFNLGLAYATKGMFEEALAQFEKLQKLDPAGAAKGKLWVYGQTGRVNEARRIATELEQAGDKSMMTPFEYVFLYTALGDKDRAFAWLEKVSLRGMNMARLKFEPQLDLLRSDVRFAQYLSRHESELRPLQLPS